MNYSKIKKTIYTLGKEKDVIGLNRFLKVLSARKRKLDWWFEKYIGIFDDQLSSPDVSKLSPIKLLYVSKYNEYETLSAIMYTIRYHLQEIERT